MAEDFTFKGFQSPNYTQVPDELFDELLAVLSGSELKVLLYIIRRTFGFKKPSDNISLSQITDGIVRADGTRLDSGTGLVKSTAALALKGLAEKNIIIKVRNQSPGQGDTATTYALNLQKQPVQKSDPPVSENRTPGGSEIGHPEGQKSDTQETVRQNTELNNVNVREIRQVGQGARSASIPATINHDALRSSYGLTDPQLGRVEYLVERQGHFLGSLDRNHRNYVKRAAEAIRDRLDGQLEMALRDFAEASRAMKEPPRVPPAYFQAIWDHATQAILAARSQPNQTPPKPTLTISKPGLQPIFDDVWRKMTALGVMPKQAPESPAVPLDPKEQQRRRVLEQLQSRGFNVPPELYQAPLSEIMAWHERHRQPG
jgi:hypothetical protein